MKVNALCTKSSAIAKKHCDKLFTSCCDNRSIECETIAEFSKSMVSGDIYLSTMSDEELFELACDYIISNNVRAVVRAAYDLYETGIIEARHGLSPIMLLHKLGVLDKCAIAGGVCLDNDDLDLMAQEKVPLILLPTADAGYGHGYAPVCAAVKRGIRIGIGTFDGKYNKDHDLYREIEFLKLTANAEMRSENALSELTINNILRFA